MIVSICARPRFLNLWDKRALEQYEENAQGLTRSSPALYFKLQEAARSQPMLAFRLYGVLIDMRVVQALKWVNLWLAVIRGVVRFPS